MSRPASDVVATHFFGLYLRYDITENTENTVHWEGINQCLRLSWDFLHPISCLIPISER